MNISSGLNTVSSLYGQQKSNYMKAPASAEKTFYTAETPKVYQIFTTDNMLWTMKLLYLHVQALHQVFPYQ